MPGRERDAPVHGSIGSQALNRPKNVGASVRTRLLNRAKESGSDYGLMLTKYALERLLYRLSISQWSDAFLLKGALLFDLWFDQPHRPTRDIDLLGFGSSEVDGVAAVFRGVCALAYEDGMAAPVMRAYSAYTVIAEKFQAMVSLGMVNTRLKDYFDLWVLANHVPLDPSILAEAIAATFARRGTPMPEELPLGLSDAFTHDRTKIQQWNAFLGKNKLQAPPLDALVSELRPLLWRKRA